MTAFINPLGLRAPGPRWSPADSIQAERPRGPTVRRTPDLAPRGECGRTMSKSGAAWDKKTERMLDEGVGVGRHVWCADDFHSGLFAVCRGSPR